MRFPSPVLAAAAAVAATATAAPSRAHAGEREPSAAIAYGVTAGELATVGIFYLNFGTDLVPNHGPGLAINFTPMLIGPAVGFGARGADPRPALAVHGAAWAGFDLFMVGALIDGRHEKTRMKIGPAALTLGALGAIAGGYVSYKELDTDRQSSTALIAGPLGFAAGGVIIGGIYVVAGGVDGDKSISQFATGAAIGLTAGLAFAAWNAYADDPPSRTLRLANSLNPSVEPGPRRFLVSFGGAF